MTDAKQIVQKTRDLLAQCSDVRWEQAAFRGVLTKSASTVSLLQALDSGGDTQIELEKFDGSVLSLETAISTVEEGGKLRLSVHPVRTQWAFVAKDFDDLLEHFNFRIKEPRTYLISDVAYTNADENASQSHLVKAYRRTLTFINLLRSLAEYVDLPNETFIFIGGKRRLDLKIVYSSHEMNQEPRSYEKYSYAFSEGLHYEVKKNSAN